jgi:hypothetical protein
VSAGDRRDVAPELEAIRARLAELAADPPAEGVAEEIGLIRAQLRVLALANEEVGERLGESLGLRQTRNTGSAT